MIINKIVSVGAFGKLDVDFKDQDVLLLEDSGKEVEGKFGSQTVFKMKFMSGEVKNMNINQTSLNKLVDAFGSDTDGWVGKEVQVHVVKQMVSGKMTKVLYYTEKGGTLDEE